MQNKYFIIYEPIRYIKYFFKKIQYRKYSILYLVKKIAVYNNIRLYYY